MLRRLDIEELKRLAEESGFAIEPAEEEQFSVLSDSILGILDGLDAQAPAEFPVVEAVRDPGRPPEPGEDPNNAIVRWCRVRAESEDGVLSGKRITMKDSVAIAGIPLTCGSRVLAGFPIGSFGRGARSSRSRTWTTSRSPEAETPATTERR